MPDDRPVILVDEAATNWARESFDAGVRLGDKIESQRREWMRSIGGER